jgi:hypothetical protein
MIPADQVPDGTVVGATAADWAAPIPSRRPFSWRSTAHFTTAVLRDVSELRRADAVVREAEERFQGAPEYAIGMALVSTSRTAPAASCA